jgi:hypothetical protein
VAIKELFERRQGIMENNDIYSIVERLAILEGRITPTNVKHGLNDQQKSAKQLPALFRPKTQKILGGDADEKNPLAGYAVGGCEENKELEEEISKDVLGKVKASFTDYLSSLEDEIKQDRDLLKKKKEDLDIKKKELKDLDLQAKHHARVQEPVVEDPTEEDPVIQATTPPIEDPTLPEAAVKTITNECGLWEVYGDEHTGFEIRRGNSRLPSRFKNLEEAELALEMFNSRRRKRDESQDYIDEA